MGYQRTLGGKEGDEFHRKAVTFSPGPVPALTWGSAGRLAHPRGLQVAGV